MVVILVVVVRWLIVVIGTVGGIMSGLCLGGEEGSIGVRFVDMALSVFF